MGLFKDPPNWDKVGGLRDLAGLALQRELTPWSVGGMRGNPSPIEPFIWVPLPPLEGEDSRKLGEDFLLRDGNVSRSSTDVSRLTKLLFDTSRGDLFSAKQNMLSHSGVATEASGIVNEGIYIPTSTLAQAGVVALGGHLNKQGVNPFRKTGPDDGNTILGFDVTNPLGIPLYAQVVRNDQPNDQNRLVGYFNNKINKTQKASTSTPSLLQSLTGNFIKLDGPNILDSYSGGPGSTLGVGRTTINMSPEQRTGKNNVSLDQSGFFSESGRASKVNPNIKFKDFQTPPILERGGSEFAATIDGATTGDVVTLPFFDYSVFTPVFNQKSYEGIVIKANQILNENSSVSLTYQRLTDVNTLLDTSEGGIRNLSQNQIFLKDTSVYQNGFETNELVTNPEGSYSSTLSQKQLIDQPLIRNSISGLGADFRTILTKQPEETIAKSLDYLTKDMAKRVNIGDPGARGDRSNYQFGKIGPGATKTTALDKITAKPLYQSTGPTTDADVNDLVKFRIASIDSTNPANNTYIHFRAFLGSFSDNYNASWGSQKFMGRAENFYNYEGFDRSISMNWTVPAQSKGELMIMHQKLNFLASNLAPDYVGDRFMAGPLVKLTVGGYLYEQYGFIESLSFTVPEASPWEIAVAGSPKDGTEFGGSGLTHDPSVKELPQVIEVSSFSFKPIHNFVVQKQQNTYAGPGKSVSNYGRQKYISLASASPNGYNVKQTLPENTGGTRE